MMKRRKQQKKRRDSRAKQAAKHEEGRRNRAVREYQGSQQESFDGTNERIRGTGGDAPAPIGPDINQRDGRRARMRSIQTETLRTSPAN
jgi:hypothetical protein